MELPLTPLEFARRARRLYPDREAVVDGDVRLTYRQFFERCDRWSAALQRLGVVPGDRVAYIAPNTHAQLESFYAVPQIGGVVVPIDYRLTPADFTYLIQHSGAKVVCAHSDYLDAVDSIRGELPGVQAFVALESPRGGWLDYEAELAAAPASFDRPEIREGDLITINGVGAPATSSHVLRRVRVIPDRHTVYQVIEPVAIREAHPPRLVGAEEVGHAIAGVAVLPAHLRLVERVQPALHPAA